VPAHKAGLAFDNPNEGANYTRFGDLYFALLDFNREAGLAGG
jgi:hypothetical protein